MPFYEGPLDCRIAFVGEAPGGTEVQAGRPFVGKAGQLFNRLLETVGINRTECYIDNVFQERPNANDVKPWLDLSRKHAVESDRYRKALFNLKARLDACNANVIVALGGTALYALTGQRAITKRRGSILSSDLLPGRKVIPTIHPSAALRQYLDSHLIKFDLKRVIDESYTDGINLLDRELILLPSFEQVMDYLDYCHNGGHEFVAYDIEVTRGEVSHISFSYDAASGICVPLLVEGKDRYTPPQEMQIWLKIAALLSDPKIQKVGQNITFDATFLFRKYGIRTASMHDTMIAQAILLPDFPKGLDFIQSMYCKGEPYYKDDGKEWFKYAEGEKAFRRYSAMDSVVVAEAWPCQVTDLEAQGNWETYNKQRKLIEPLVFIGERGIRLDNSGLTQEAVNAKQKIEVLEGKLASLTGDATFNWRSVPQLKRYFYGTLGLRQYTRRGSVTTDDKAMRRIAAKGIREAQLILDLRHEAKLHGTYYTMDLDADQRLRCSYNPVGTKQGRISSSKTIFGTGGNLQNQPPEMKRLMLADPGYILVGLDLSQAENRVVAYDAEEHRMIDAFEKGIDIHVQTAAMIYNVPMEEVTDELRANGKRANHGLNYDLGANSFAMYYQINFEDADFIVERYHQIYPGVRLWHGQIKNELGRTRTLVNLFGRKRTFMDRWGHDMWKEAYSYIPQSTVATITNDTFHFIYNDERFAAVPLVNTVHDSVVIQIPIALGVEFGARTILTIKEFMERPLETHGRSFSIPVDVKVGDRLDEEKKSPTRMTELKAKLLTDVSATAELLEPCYAKSA
jgi:uracil-DNA glycosylase family 4